MLRAWRNGDVFGAQSSVGVLFDYQGREHAVMVLLDHLLSCGVKDCWVAEGRPATDLGNSVATAMTGEPHTFFEGIDAATAADLLARALACPPWGQFRAWRQDVVALFAGMYCQVMTKPGRTVARPSAARGPPLP